MLEVKAGDMSALETLVKVHRPRIVRYLNGITRDHAASEELTQEVFLRVHRGRHQYEPTAKFTTWLYTIASRLALNWRRDNERRALDESLDEPSEYGNVHQYADPHIRIDEWLVCECRRAEVRRAIHALPERQRTVVLLHKFDDVDCQSIAARLGCTHQAVRSALVRAYIRIRKDLTAPE